MCVRVRYCMVCPRIVSVEVCLDTRIMSPVSERVVDASPPEWGNREVRLLALAAIARLQAGQSGVSPRLDRHAAPSLAMSKGVALFFYSTRFS